ncbi:MAG TPA: hypothetical protein VG028_08290 [Terriglobia bacterium]|nr:hypothetical protein [Terriglobia bacterium]
MECVEAQPFVSELHDGETIPRRAADHIAACPTCRERLRAYAEIGVGLRLLASSTHDEGSSSLPTPAPSRSSLFRPRSLSARILVPRFAVALGIVAFLGLPIGLGLMWAQTAGSWFQFQVISPEGQASWGAQVQAGTPLPPISARGGSGVRIVTQVRVLEIRNDRVRLIVKARRVQDQAFNNANPSRANSVEALNQIISSAPSIEFSYRPGQVLEIPVAGGGKINLSGRVLAHAAGFLPTDYPLAPKPDQMVVTNVAIVRDEELLGSMLGSGSVQAEDPGVEVYVPKVGLLVFMLHPMTGAVEAQAEFGQVRFALGGHDFFLFSATPVTGGDQPRTIWVYRNPDYRPPGFAKPPDFPVFLGVGKVSTILQVGK